MDSEVNIIHVFMVWRHIFDHNGETLKLRVMDRKGEPVNVSYWH